MHIHILGICGTFMAGVAQLARALGTEVSGSDANAWPPMSEQLEAAGIAIGRGYEPAHLEPAPDEVVIGNALSRGNAAVEHVLDARLPYTSGPAWLAEHVLKRRPVLAIAGTHGKTTTSSLLAFILERAGLEPGYLIGGVAPSLGASARLGASDAPFVIEADEYDSAFFDKRSKFVHYRPDVLVMNNLEFDHADIFDDMTAIRRQFHHLIRTVPANGNVLSAHADAELEQVLAMGCWSELERFGETASADWQVELRDPAGRSMDMRYQGRKSVRLDWQLAGRHNALNALAAVAAAAKVGVSIETSCEALAAFDGIRRRLELRGEAAGVTVYDDFAHHPTAIAATLDTLRALGGTGRIIALVDPVSNTMRMGVHEKTLGPALARADRIFLLDKDNLQWDPQTLHADIAPRSPDDRARLSVHADVADIVECYASEARAGDRVVAMSNASFGGIHERLLERLREMP